MRPQQTRRQILVLPLNQPQGCVGYRIMQNGKVISYCTDAEHSADWSNKNLTTFAKDPDLFIPDSQYTPEERGNFKRVVKPAGLENRVTQCFVLCRLRRGGTNSRPCGTEDSSAVGRRGGGCNVKTRQ